MIKKIFILALLFPLFFACKKPVEKGYCNVEWITNGGIHTWILDSVKYHKNMEILEVEFNLEGLNSSIYVPCYHHNDTVVGNIEYINIIANYYYSNDTIIDTINNLLKVKINNFDDQQTLKISDIDSLQPYCGDWLDIRFIAPPVLNCSQSYTIYYKEVGRDKVWTYSVPKFYFSQ